METLDEITSVKEALSMVTNFIGSNSENIDIPIHRRYFGYWFRGQVEFEWDVKPAIYRGQFEEARMFDHFRTLRPEYNATHKTDFDWLTLMQHYGMPTRLVDWTENLLVGLFFALWHEHGEVDNDKDGALFILSARKLNHAAISHFDIQIPDSYHVAMRTALACSETEKAWLAQMQAAHFLKSSVGADEFELIIEQNNISMRKTLFSEPIAVFPNRTNDRLIAQAGVFTIHGGKQGIQNESFPATVDLNSLNNAKSNDQKFIWKYRVSKERREELLNELRMVGVHQGTLFPDLDHQSQYLRELWKRF